MIMYRHGIQVVDSDMCQFWGPDKSPRILVTHSLSVAQTLHEPCSACRNKWKFETPPRCRVHVNTLHRNFNKSEKPDQSGTRHYDCALAGMRLMRSDLRREVGREKGCPKTTFRRHGRRQQGAVRAKESGDKHDGLESSGVM